MPIEAMVWGRKYQIPAEWYRGAIGELMGLGLTEGEAVLGAAKIWAEQEMKKGRGH